MSAQRTFSPGRLLSACFGVARGTTVSDWDLTTSQTVQVSVQIWGDGSGNTTGWVDTAKQVKAYAGMPFTDVIPQGSTVWMFYVFGTYFVVLTTC